MLIHADIKSLELVTAAYLSRDPVLIQEIRDAVDIHENNKSRFNLPERRIAKIFVFRLIYGGQAYSYAHDKDFNHISQSQDYWTIVIGEFYEKYKGMARWHEQLVKTVLDTGCLVMPTGRRYIFDRADVAKRLWFHRPKILNYPVQGTGADIVAIGRVTLWKRLRKQGLPALFVSTVHDSVDLDVDNSPEIVYNVALTVKQSFEDIPANFQRLFGVPFDLPINVEIEFGPNLEDTQPFHE